MSQLTNGTYTRTAGFLALAFPIVLAASAAYRAAPFIDDIPGASGDDWYTYKTLAEDVLRQGWTMPSFHSGMAHGFMYAYFVAAIFAMFGVNTAYVYVVQSAMAGASASLMYVAFRRKLSPPVALGMLVSLDVVVCLDVYRSIAFRLLSENLYLILCPLMWIMVLRAVDKPGRWLFSLGAGFALGVLVLTRPSFILAAGSMVGLLWLRALWTTRSVKVPAWFTAGVMCGLGIIVVRNVSVSGKLTFDIITNTSDWIRIWALPLGECLRVLAARILFAFGVPEVMVATYRLRPHWIAAWVVAGGGLVVAWRRQQAIQFWEVLVLAFIVCYIVPVILVADISSYGGRMVVAVLPMVIVMAARAVDRSRFAHDVFGPEPSALMN